MAENQEYEAAAHAMQTAVGYQLATTVGRALVARGMSQAVADEVVRALKHLRVGVNSAMSDAGALTALLIKKGVFTEDEYRAAVLEWMKREAELNARMARTDGGLPGSVSFV
jgi:hypothetical protein